MNGNIYKLEKWLSTHCDNDWEHDDRIIISNIDNPGWLVRISLEGTLLNKCDFSPVKVGDSENKEQKWIDCKKESDYFIGLGSQFMLDEIFDIFFDWSEKNTDTSPWDNKVQSLIERCTLRENESSELAIVRLRQLYAEIEDIPNEHPLKKKLLTLFYSEWNKLF